MHESYGVLVLSLATAWVKTLAVFLSVSTLVVARHQYRTDIHFLPIFCALRRWHPILPIHRVQQGHRQYDAVGLH